jgi:iron(III) transport system substrate-binding protein
MPGLVPGIHVFLFRLQGKQDVDGRDKPGHDGEPHKGDAMITPRITRRGLLKATTALAATSVFAAPLRAQAPAAVPVTPTLIDAARKEGKVVFYTAMDLPVGERLAKAFEAKYSGITVKVERTGSERLFQRIGQEFQSRVFAADVVNSADAAHFIVWKRNGWLAPFLPEEVAQHFPAEHRDPDGMFASGRVWLSCIGYNTKLVKPEDAPKSFADLLDPKWAGKMVKAHPGYSGTIMTATFQIARDLGWEYLEKLSKQRVMQVQSSTDPPKKLALGERAVMADGNDYNLIQLKERGEPLEAVYPTEGTPLIVGPNGVFANAPNPNAARLFQSFVLSAEGQQILIDFAGQHSVHARTEEKPGRRKLSEIKLMKDDPAGVERSADDIKKRYAQLFKV